MTTRRGPFLRYLAWLVSTAVTATLGLGAAAHGTVAVDTATGSSAAAAVPVAPTEITVALDATEDAVVTTWSGGSGGGAPITKYVVNAISSMGGPQVEVGPTASNAVLSGLLVRKDYWFTVTVWNADGQYAVSQQAGPIALPYRLPSPATNVTAVAGVESAVVSWAPADGHGASIQGYFIDASPVGGRFQAPGDATSMTVDGLNGDTPVTFTLVAWTRRGQSERSAPSAAVTPTEALIASGGGSEVKAPPERPTRVVTIVAGHKVVVRWGPPASKVTTYRVTLKRRGFNEIGIRLPGTARRAVYKSIRPGVYVAKVTARNKHGWSEVSRGSRVVVR